MSIDIKIQSQLDEMLEHGDLDKNFFSVKIDKDIEQKILEYQLLHVINIIASIKKHKIAIDGSWTGTGKTYTSIAACKQLNLSPYIICPKSIMGTWRTVCEYFNVKPLAIVNYETIKSGKEYDINLKKIKSNNLTITEKGFEWNFPSNNIIVILDEVHRCKHSKSINGKLLLSLKDKVKILMLSATLCDKTEDFLPFGYMLSLYKNLKSGKSWILHVIREASFRMDVKNGNALNKHIYPTYGSQMSMEDIGKKFPKNQVSAECYYVNNKVISKINKYYEKLVGLQNEKDCELGIKIKLRQKIELLKVDILFDIAQKYLEQGKSVVVFVNFINSLEKLEELFNLNQIIYSELRGTQTASERDESIDNFQKNKVKVMLSMIQVGSSSIGLHDLTGRSPRVSIISPSFSSIELIQTLGRIYRSGLKTPTLQRIIFCSSTYEEKICQIIRSKIKFMSSITDEDLISI